MHSLKVLVIWAIALLVCGSTGCNCVRDWATCSCDRCLVSHVETVIPPAATKTDGELRPKPAEPGAPGSDQSRSDNAFAQAPAAGTEAESIGNPNMMGDFLRGFVTQQVGVIRITLPPAKGSNSTVLVPITVSLPEVGAGGSKIAENESPRPQDRVFVTYNYYDNIVPSINGNSGLSTINLHAETIGGETTFMNGDASLGIRVPVYQLVGPEVVTQERLGDISIIAKYAWLNDSVEGNVFSTGLMVTAPTSRTTVGLLGDRLNSTIVQPFAGAIVQLGPDAYLHGFSSLAVPTDSRDATFLFNDVGVGYWLFRDSEGDALTGLVPTVEIHVNTPFNNEGIHHQPIGALDSIALTGGLHVLFGPSVLQLGAATPMTGPKPFDIEAFAQLNYRY